MREFYEDSFCGNPPEGSAQIDLNDYNEQILEEEYINFCVNYSMKQGFITAKQIPILIENYLKPLFQVYIKTIEDVKEGIQNEPDKERILQKVIRLLNKLLYCTRRIGSTDPNNIILSVNDLYRIIMGQFSANEYDEYAMTSLIEEIERVIFDC